MTPHNQAHSKKSTSKYLFGTPASHKLGTPVSTWKGHIKDHTGPEGPHATSMLGLSGTEGSFQILTGVLICDRLGFQKKKGMEELFVLRVYYTLDSWQE